MFKKGMAALSLIVVLIITYLGLPQEVKAVQTVEDIQNKGTLILGTSADYPPYEFHATIDGKDEIIGMDISLAQAIADELDVELQIEDLGFDALLPALEAGSVDMVISGMSPTPEREKSVSFSKIYYEDKPSIVILEKNRDLYGSQESLDGQTVGAQTGSIQAEFAEQIEGAETYFLNDINQLIIALQTGKIEAMILTNSTAQIYQQNRGDLYIYEGDFEGGEVEGNAVAFPLGSDDLVEVADGVIDEALANNQIETWLEEVAPYVETSEEGAEEESFLGQYWPLFWQGTKTTILVSVIGVFFGVILGILLALMRLSDQRILSALATAYIEFVRGTPLLIQVMFIYFGLGMLVNIQAIVAGIIAISLNSGAYVAEIIRSGLSSIPVGQFEASRSLGLSYIKTMRHIVFPQALKNIWPALGNEFVTIIKESSIISTIGVAELTYQTGIIQTQSYKGILPLFISMVLYFILTYTLTKVLNYFENRMSY